MLYATRTAIAVLALGRADGFALGPYAAPTVACRASNLRASLSITPPPPAGFVWADEEMDIAPTSSGESVSAETTPASSSNAASEGSNAAFEGSNAAPEAVVPQVVEKPKPKKTEAWKQGIFAPGVLAAKALLGEQELKELRASVITKHSKVIADFVDTSESKFGQLVLRRMFEYADKDGNGTLDREEVKAALLDLGFDFLDSKQVSTLMKKADSDKNEVIDFEEFVASTPKALRTNLVKLAKKNGHDLGFLV